MLGNIEPHRLGSGRRDAVATATDAGHPQNGLTAGDDGIASPLAARHARFHQEPPQWAVAHPAERQQLVALGGSPHLPTGAVHPGGPALALDTRRRCTRSPIDPERAEHGAAPLPRRDHPLGRALHRAGDAQPVERHFRGPSAAQREPAARRPSRQCHEASGPRRPEHEAATRSPRCGAQQRNSQRFIIAEQRAPGNGKAGGRDLKPKLGNEFQRAVPGAPIRSGLPAETAQVAGDAGAEAVFQKWEQLSPYPRAQVTRVRVCGIRVRGEPARRGVHDELVVSERQQRPHESVTAAARDPRESGRRAAAQRAQHDGLDLIILVMRGDEIGRAQAVLHVTEPRVTRTPRSGFSRVGSETQLDGLEWQFVFLGQLSDRPADRPSGRLNPVIDMRHNKGQFHLRGHTVQQIQQRDGVRATGDCDEGRPRLAEQARALDVDAEAFGKRCHLGHVSLSMLPPDQTYQLLRNLTSPVVAVTSERDGRENGMISDAAIRASIVPTVPRLSVYVHKFNFSHDLIFDTGRFVLHLLHTKQFDLIHRLGFVSGRDRDKLADVPHHSGALGAPILDDCYAHFECRVANVMDTGSSTLFLGDVAAVGFGAETAPRGEVMTASYFRAHMPVAWRTEYEALLQSAQRTAADTSRAIKPVVWRGLQP